MSQLLPWYWRSQPLAHRTGSMIFAALFRRFTVATLLESPPSSLSRYSICAGPPRIINHQPQLWTPAADNILACLRKRLQQASGNLSSAPPPSLPFTGGWLGWLGYDFAWEIEDLPRINSDPLPFPVAYWYEPEAFAVLDHQQQELWLASSHPDQLDELEDRLQYSDYDDSPVGGDLLKPSVLLTSHADYKEMVRSAQEHIRAGDIFQANLSTRFVAQARLDPWDLYCRLYSINPSPFASYWQTPWGSVVSCSPERLVQLRGEQVQVRPIAGTRARGQTLTLDQCLAQELSTNAKEQAEHIMLVDLERNDLGRVCQWGSVVVDELLTIETYSHVMHLVSNIKGLLTPTHDVLSLIRAVFPGGTITGCPKVRCMEIIEQLEPVRRSLFYGSCGYLDYRGHLDLNILIRTLLVVPEHEFAPLRQQPVKIWGQVGAGIVADSDPQKEWEESLQKAQAQLIALRQMTGHI
ncbi:anthranilate synthase component I [Acaryochloris thomasi]|nr:anthranilate synthase component I [Acaryochloris thomasi]